MRRKRPLVIRSRWRGCERASGRLRRRAGQKCGARIQCGALARALGDPTGSGGAQGRPGRVLLGTRCPPRASPPTRAPGRAPRSPAPLAPPRPRANLPPPRPPWRHAFCERDASPQSSLVVAVGTSGARRGVGWGEGSATRGGRTSLTCPQRRERVSVRVGSTTRRGDRGSRGSWRHAVPARPAVRPGRPQHRDPAVRNPKPAPEPGRMRTFAPWPPRC